MVNTVMHCFFHIFKNQNAITNDAVKRAIEAVILVKVVSRHVGRVRMSRTKILTRI